MASKKNYIFHTFIGIDIQVLIILKINIISAVKQFN